MNQVSGNLEVHFGTGRISAQKVYGLAKNQGLLQNSLVDYDVVHCNVADSLAVWWQNRNKTTT